MLWLLWTSIIVVLSHFGGLVAPVRIISVAMLCAGTGCWHCHSVCLTGHIPWKKQESHSNIVWKTEMGVFVVFLMQCTVDTRLVIPLPQY